MYSFRKPFFLLPVFLIGLLTLTGCLGNGGPSTAARTNTPEEAVRNLAASWANTAKPLVAPTLDSTATATITFWDISRTASWTFDVTGTDESQPGRALVYARYRFLENLEDTINIKFEMVLYEGRWVFDNFTLETFYVVTGTTIKGYVTDTVSNKPIADVPVILYDGLTVVAETMSDSTGYYSLNAPGPGVYTVVAAKDGYEYLTKTITIN